MIYKIETNKMSIFIQRETENIELNMPQPMTYIYRFSGPTGKSYIGQTKNIPRRISQHLDGEGSKLLLRDMVEFGRKAFKIEIVDILTTDDPAMVATMEDMWIDRLDCIHPLGYNKRTNREPTANGQPVDLSNLGISAKYVFEANGKRCFTIGAASNNRSYQTLCNAGCMPGLTKKRNFGFDFFELRVEPFEFPFIPAHIYDMTLRHENGAWHIVEL